MIDKLVPPRSRSYARKLLSSIVSYQRWGFSRFSLRRGWHTFFKGGWRTTGLRLAGARGGAVRAARQALLDGRADRRQPVARLRDGDAARRRAAHLQVIALALRWRWLQPVRRKPAPPASSTSTATGPASACELVYLTPHNLTGRRLPGYCREWALLLDPAARDLGRVQRRLRRRGLGLLVLDAYRPARASRALVRWARRSGRGDLVGHLHRAPQPPQHRQRGGPHPGARRRRQAPAHGLALRRAQHRAPTRSTRPAARSTTDWCWSTPWSASASPATGGSGGISSGPRRALRYLDLSLGC